MSTQAAVEPTEKLDELIAQAAPVVKRFELNRAHLTPAFHINWPPMGDIQVKHRLRRPRPSEEAQYKRQSLIQERISRDGQIRDEGNELNSARRWLWDQIAVAISGYPGLQADEQGWVELTPALKEQMRAADKETAIGAIFDCETTILLEESMRTYTGGEWAARLRLGKHGSFYASMKLRFNEWDQRQKHKFEQSASAGGSEIQGKTKLVTTAVNQTAFRELFKATLIDVSADPDGAHDAITVDGETFSMLNRDKFAEAFLGEWTVDVMTELAQMWQGK